MQAFEAHEVDSGRTFEVGQPNVENGSPGWDAPFDADTDGDSWYTETKDETTCRQVSTTEDHLRYFCLVHPFMNGKVKVEAAYAVGVSTSGPRAGA